MKNPFLRLLMAVACFSFQAANAQVSINVVGYSNVRLYPGDNLIANQLLNGDNTLNTVLTTGTAAGSTFTMWDAAASNFLPLSMFDGISWSINYSFSLGRGGLLNSPVMATNTFFGDVPIYTNIIGNQLGSGLRWDPSYANGLHLLSIPEPIADSGSNLFYDVTARGPHDGESVQTLDPSTQAYTTTTYHTGSGWDNGDPMLNVGQAAWFNLGPVAVPEPSALALSGLGILAVWGSRRKANGS